MDITQDFRSLTALHAANTHLPRTSTKDAFIREAYRLHRQIDSIQEYLNRVRKAYLSSSATGTKHTKNEITHLTDKQREDIDYEVKKNVREAADRIKDLEEIEAERRRLIDAKSTYWTKLLRDPAEDSQNKLLSTHRSGITWYLNHSLLRINQRHADTKTQRLAREEEKRLATHTTRQSKPKYAYDLTDEENKMSQVESELTVRESLLSAEQLQELETENTQILQEFENQLGQVRSVQSKLMEIAELSSELQQHLQSQTEMTDRLMDEAIDTTRDVTQGNEQLTQAKRRNATYRLYIVTILLTLAFTLLFLDYYAS